MIIIVLKAKLLSKLRRYGSFAKKVATAAVSTIIITTITRSTALVFTSAACISSTGMLVVTSSGW